MHCVVCVYFAINALQDLSLTLYRTSLTKNVTVTDKFAFSLAFAESIFKKSIFKITKYLKKVFWKYKIKYTDKSILEIQNKILFCIFKIKYYFENSILHITAALLSDRLIPWYASSVNWAVVLGQSYFRHTVVADMAANCGHYMTTVLMNMTSLGVKLWGVFWTFRQTHTII